MFPKLRPADELAMIRAQIKALRLREDELKAGFLSGTLNRQGFEVSVELSQQKRRTFLKDMLPDDILDDPQYWRETPVRAVVIRKLGERQRAAIQRGSRDEPQRYAGGFGR